MFTVSDLSIINVFIIVNASLSYHTIHMAISNSCTHSCFIWQIFQNIITWVLEKACFPFFQTNQSTSGREKMTCDSIWHCYQSTAFRARIGESDWVVSRLIWRASVDKTSYLLHTVWSQNIGEPSLYFKSITLHLHGVNEWIPLESFDYWKVHWGLLQQNSDLWRHILACIDEYKKNGTGIISQDFSVN